MLFAQDELDELVLVVFDEELDVVEVFEELEELEELLELDDAVED